MRYVPPICRASQARGQRSVTWQARGPRGDSKRATRAPTRAPTRARAGRVVAALDTARGDTVAGLDRGGVARRRPAGRIGTWDRGGEAVQRGARAARRGGGQGVDELLQRAQLPANKVIRIQSRACCSRLQRTRLPGQRTWGKGVLAWTREKAWLLGRGRPGQRGMQMRDKKSNGSEG